jgi:His/Glu/Gln/Arg/opine family amino acid ABC transporter permease subunit
MGKLFDFDFLLEAFPKILRYLPVTLEITFAAMAIGLVLGLGIALSEIHNVPFFKQLGKGYVAFIRGTPLMVLIYLTYFGIPLILEGINRQLGTAFNTNSVPPLAYAFVALGLNDAAFNSVAIRSAIESVNKGEIEAAYSLGMSALKTFKRVIAPQALIIAVPNLGNQLIGLIKGTSLAFTVSVVDIMASARIQGSRGMRFVEVYIDVAIIYWIVCFIAGKCALCLERRLRRSESSAAPEEEATDSDSSLMKIDL